MAKKLGHRTIISIFGSIVIIILFCILAMQTLRWMRYTYSKNMLGPVAHRVGIEPTWEALDEYMGRTFIEGMSREEVYKKLDQFGDYKVTPGNTCEFIELPVGDTIFMSQPELKYMFCFLPEDDTLEYWTSWPG